MATTPRNELMKINSLPTCLFDKAFNKPLSKESKERILSTKQSCVGFWSEVDMFSLELDILMEALSYHFCTHETW